MEERLGRIIDISRLLARMSRPTPTGIDRVEFAYLQYYVNKYRKGIVRFFITTPLYSGRISPFFARQVARLSLGRWSLADESTSNKNFSDLMSTLASPIGPHALARRVIEPRANVIDGGTNTMIFNAYYQAALSSIFQARRQREIQRRSWYIHVSHMHLDEPQRLAWIRKADGRALFMMHDLIPITHPEFSKPGHAKLHVRRVETVARLGSLIVFDSAAARSAWDDYVKDQRLPRPPGAVVPLGVDPVFLDRGMPDEPRGTPYFVVVNTITARKNLSFLLHVFREWIRRSSQPQARLVIIGWRESAGESALDLLDRCPLLAPSVIEVSEVTDIRVARLMKGAQALLSPSLAEGFGLPIVEALALGIPVIASDIPSHREAGGTVAEYLDPLDGPGWIAALDDFAENNSPRRQAALARIAAHKSRSWDDHIGDVEDLLRDRD